MIRALAIDDEPLALEVIRSHAAKVPFLNVEGYFNDGFDAVAHLARAPVDVLFLDIKMPDLSGFELVGSLNTRPMVVFTTAYAEHAVQSYDLDAVDYLLKPFSFSRFLKACHKVNDLLAARQGTVATQAESIFIKSGYEQVRIALNDILYLESAGNYMSFILNNDRRILSRLTMAEALEALPGERFLRAHRSYIVNRQKIDRVERHQVHVEGKIVPVNAGFRLEPENPRR